MLNLDLKIEKITEIIRKARNLAIKELLLHESDALLNLANYLPKLIENYKLMLAYIKRNDTNEECKKILVQLDEYKED